MKLPVVVVAGTILPFLSIASPLYFQDADAHRPGYSWDPYPGGYRGAGGYGGVNENRYRGADDDPSARAGWGRDPGDYDRDNWVDQWQQEDGGSPQRSDRSLTWPQPWFRDPARQERDPSQDSNGSWSPSRPSDSFGLNRSGFPTARGSYAEPYGYERRGSGPATDYVRQWPDVPPRRGTWPSDGTSYRYRGDGAAGDLWRGYRFRPLSGPELQRMRPEQVPSPRWGGAVAAPPPAGQGHRGQEAFGYEPDGWFRRYYGEQP